METFKAVVKAVLVWFADHTEARDLLTGFVIGVLITALVVF